MTNRPLIPRPRTLQTYKAIRQHLLLHLQPPAHHTCEHAVPRSKCAQTVADLNNLFFIPARCNSLRSNYKLVDAVPTAGARVAAHDGWLFDHRLRWCTPGEEYRGRYARSCAYVAGVLPHLADLLFVHVMDPRTMLLWHLRHPSTRDEHGQSRLARAIQGNANTAVDDPDCVPWILDRLTNS